MDKCRSPINPGCGERDIAVYIVFDGKVLPVCRKCWRVIADTDLEWWEGISEDRLKRSVEEARREVVERVKRKVLEEMAKRTVKRKAK